MMRTIAYEVSGRQQAIGTRESDESGLTALGVGFVLGLIFRR